MLNLRRRLMKLRQARNIIRPSETQTHSNLIRPSKNLSPELLEDAARSGREFREQLIKQGVIKPGEQGFIEGGRMVFRNPSSECTL